MIKIKNFDKEKQKLSFVTDMNLSLINAVRRSVLEIPVIAIDEVDIIKNDSALYDEILAHRIGLIPIKTESNKEIKFKLKEIGPKTVYSSDLKPYTGINLKIPLVILDKEQEIEMVCEARLGKGIEHIKYSPGLMFYKHDVDEEILDFIHIDDNGKVSFDEEEFKRKEMNEEQIKKIKSVKEVSDFEINIESWGQLDARDIFTKAIDALDDNLNELGKAVK